MKTIAFNIEAMKPGCVLLQAAMGCDPAVVRGFDATDWIVDGPDVQGLKVYPVTDEQLKALEDRVKARHSKP
jgi:hypothetical protein